MTEPEPTSEGVDVYLGVVKEWTDFVTTPEGEFELSELTIRQYHSTIQGFGFFINFRSPSSVTRGDIDSYVTSLRKAKLQASTVHNKLSALKSFFYVLKAIGIVTSDPTEKVKVTTRRGRRKRGRQERRYLTYEEMDKLRKSLANWRNKIGIPERTQLRDQIIIELLYTTGLRRRELVSRHKKWGLIISKINFEENTITVLRKGGFIQDVLITDLVPDIKSKMQNYIAEKELSLDDKLFNLSTNWVGYICKKWGKRAGIETKVTAHMLRHSFGSHLGDMGVPAHIIQALLDHKSITTTDQYVHTSKEGMVKVLQDFGLFTRKKEKEEG